MSEANTQAAVHCVIVGFSIGISSLPKMIYDGGKRSIVNHINGYLIGAPDVFLQARGKPLNVGLPEMTKGSQPTDGGYLLLSPADKDDLIRKYPESKQFIRQYIGANEYINKIDKYCLWLKGVEPTLYRSIPPIMERLHNVRECRLKSPTASVRRDADIPMLFTQIRQPDSDYLVVPETSSENRRYIPIGFVTPDIICSNAIRYIPDANRYIFGVLTSNVHMAWMRIVCGRLKSDYRYSPAVYNNFPWPESTDEQKMKIEETAQAILDARDLYPNSSLADLYDEVTMPPELCKAHQQNDRAVMAAYGFNVKETTETSCVAALMKRYQDLVSRSETKTQRV